MPIIAYSIILIEQANTLLSLQRYIMTNIRNIPITKGAAWLYSFPRPLSRLQGIQKQLIMAAISFNSVSNTKKVA